MELIILSIFAGVLTILSPCSITLLPIVLGSSAKYKSLKRPTVIILSLSISILIFTLLLRATTALIYIDPSFWNLFSGIVLILIGIFTLFPAIWGKLSYKSGLNYKSETMLHRSFERNDLIGDMLAGIALGPVFISCSPTFALIITTILPQSLGIGVVNLIAYCLGLSAILILVAILGQKLVKRLNWAINPEGRFKKFLGILFILIGSIILLGIDKEIQAYLLQNEFFLDLTRFEVDLTKKL